MCCYSIPSLRIWEQSEFGVEVQPAPVTSDYAGFIGKFMGKGEAGII